MNSNLHLNFDSHFFPDNDNRTRAKVYMSYLFVPMHGPTLHWSLHTLELGVMNNPWSNPYPCMICSQSTLLQKKIQIIVETKFKPRKILWQFMHLKFEHVLHIWCTDWNYKFIKWFGYSCSRPKQSGWLQHVFLLIINLDPALMLSA